MNLILWAMLLLGPQQKPVHGPTEARIVSIGVVYKHGAEAAMDYHTTALASGEYTVTLATKQGNEITTSGAISIEEGTGVRHLVFIVPETAPVGFYYIAALKKGHTTYESQDESVGIWVQ